MTMVGDGGGGNAPGRTAAAAAAAARQQQQEQQEQQQKGKSSRCNSATRLQARHTTQRFSQPIAKSSTPQDYA